MSETSELRSLKLRADLVLVAVTFVWGSSFIVIKNVLRDAPPLAFLSLRFSLAALLILLALPRRPPTPSFLRDGIAVGLLLGFGMSLQVIGQVDTTASNAAFRTGLSVVLTPFAAYLRTRRLPSLENGLGIVLASAGFLLLTFPKEGGPLRRGDLFVAASSVLFAFFIVELAELAPTHDAARLACVELGTVGSFVGQTWSQRHMSATHAAIIFSLEPVFAAILAGWFLQESLGHRGFAGGGLVLIGIVVSELRLRRAGKGIGDGGNPERDPQTATNVSK